MSDAAIPEALREWYRTMHDCDGTIVLMLAKYI